MSNVKTSKKIILITIGILLVLSLLVGVSYAYYIVTHSQTNSNIVKSTCISLSLTNEQNDISLDKQYPISDEDGKALTPYTFTITNTCRNAISYNLNLEMLEGTTLDSKYVKTMLNTRGAVNLDTLDTTDTSINTSTEARTLTTGVLSSEEIINYEFRMWMDSNTEADTNSMNKEFLAKIVVIGVPAKVYNFDYTGAEQVFTVPQTGTYKIETWGSQGNSGVNRREDGTYVETYDLRNGGYGGYSGGAISLKSGSLLYINVGGGGNTIIDGTTDTKKINAGGYNGGGIGLRYAAGGGATHVATKSGVLSSLANFQSEILIVSGGGAGTSAHTEGSGYCPGGSGGGYLGSNGTIVSNYDNSSAGQGGTQTTGFEFGQGENFISENTTGGGAGGGYYGGTVGDSTTSWSACGGGGSGYIGNSLLTNKAMYCYNCEESSEESTKTISTTCAEETPTSNCAKKGNGYARITYIGS